MGPASALPQEVHFKPTSDVLSLVLVKRVAPLALCIHSFWIYKSNQQKIFLIKNIQKTFLD
jgi:hypothetical protein